LNYTFKDVEWAFFCDYKELRNGRDMVMYVGIKKHHKI